MMALSGVHCRATRWRNSDLCRLAASISRFLSPISRNSRALWIAKGLRRKRLEEIHHCRLSLVALVIIQGAHNL